MSPPEGRGQADAMRLDDRDDFGATGRGLRPLNTRSGPRPRSSLDYMGSAAVSVMLEEGRVTIDICHCQLSEIYSGV